MNTNITTPENVIKRLCDRLAHLETSQEQLFGQIQTWQRWLEQISPNETSLANFARRISDDVQSLSWAFSLTENTFNWFWVCLYPNTNSAQEVARNKVFKDMTHETVKMLDSVQCILRALAVVCDAIGTIYYNDNITNVHRMIVLIQQKCEPLNRNALFQALELFNKLPGIGHSHGLNIALPYLSMNAERTIIFNKADGSEEGWE